MQQVDFATLLNLLKIIAATAISLLGGRGVIALIDLYRHRKEDLAKAKKTNAEAELLETEKKTAEFKISVDLLAILNQENENSRKQLEAAHNEIFKLRELLSEATSKIDKLEKELHGAEEKNRECAIKIEELEIELSRLRRQGNRPT